MSAESIGSIVAVGVNDADATKHASYSFYADTDGDGYGAGSAVSVCAVNATTPPSGYSLTNDDCNDADASHNPTSPCSSVVNIKMNIQGYYDTDAHAMRPVKYNQSYSDTIGDYTYGNTTDVEGITVELHDASDYSLVATTTAMLHTDGTAVATFGTAPTGSYYVVVKGSNILQTWSATAQTVGATPLTYDFTTSASQAYGDNMIELESGVYGAYSGDLSGLDSVQDDYIDLYDYSNWETDSNNGAFGVYITDLNGDGYVDLYDYSIWELNSNESRYAIYPTL